MYELVLLGSSAVDHPAREILGLHALFRVSALSAFGLPCGAGSKYCATQAQDHERLRGHIVRSLDALEATLGRVILHVMTLGELSPELTLLKPPVRVPIPADHRLLLDEWGTGSRPRIMIARTIQSACQVRH